MIEPRRFEIELITILSKIQVRYPDRTPEIISNALAVLAEDRLDPMTLRPKLRLIRGGKDQLEEASH